MDGSFAFDCVRAISTPSPGGHALASHVASRPSDAKLTMMLACAYAELKARVEEG
ncbi:MAG TPA: hypothetical protein VGF63_08905 [Solirubrobacteraceae bacterium]|jgi:hypothetical protein